MGSVDDLGRTVGILELIRTFARGADYRGAELTRGFECDDLLLSLEDTPPLPDPHADDRPDTHRSARGLHLHLREVKRPVQRIAHQAEGFVRRAQRGDSHLEVNTAPP